MDRRLALIYVGAFSTLMGGIVGALEIGKYIGVIRNPDNVKSLQNTALAPLIDPLTGQRTSKERIINIMAKPNEDLANTGREEVSLFYGTYCVPPTDTAMQAYFGVETPPKGMRVTIGEQSDRQYILVSTLDWFSENSIVDNKMKFIAPFRGSNYLLYVFNNEYAVEIRKSTNNPDNELWISARGFNEGPTSISGDMKAMRC